jgi:sulfate permease, SulP family
MTGTALTGLQKDVIIQRALPGLVTAAVLLLILISTNLSLAALIFTGSLAPFLPAGTGFLLVGTIFLVLLVSLFSSFRGTISMPQDATAVILGLVAAGISSSLSGRATPQTVFVTAVAAISLTSLLTGGLFLVLGHFRLGNLVRFIPYPVIGGFLAGTGWLLLRGSLGVMTGQSPTLATLFASGLLLRWLPGLLFGLVLLLVLRRWSHWLAFPAMLALGMLVFYLGLWAAGLSIPQAVQSGLLLQPFSDGMLWVPVHLTQFAQVEWGAILGQASTIAICCLIAVLSLLLNASSLELAARQELDLNQELRAGGLSNLAAGLAGSPIGYIGLGFSLLNHKITGGSRLTGLFLAGMMAVVLAAGAPILQLFPIAILGGLLAFLGLSFLADWLWDGRKRLVRSDFLIVVAIMVTMSIWGPLAGVGLGITLAAGLFVVQYSRVNVISHHLSGESSRSTVSRPAEQRQFLRLNGGLIQIFELQGYLFFGTAQLLLDRLRRQLAGSDLAPRYILINFRRVSGCDSSALISFTRLAQLAEVQGFTLIFTQLPPAVHRQLAAAGLLPNENEAGELKSAGQSCGHLCTFPTLDQGLEWCEDELLRQRGLLRVEQPRPFPEILGDLLQPGLDPARLAQYMTRLEVPAGEVLMRQGEAAGSIFFLESGSVTIYLETPAGQTRLTTIPSGSFVGEIAYYTGEARTASAMTLEPSLLYRLDYAHFEKMKTEDPEVAAALHRWLARLLAERVSDNVKLIAALSQ